MATRSRLPKIVYTNLRLPADLHAKLKAQADKENRSLNSLYVVLLSRALQQERD